MYLRALRHENVVVLLDVLPRGRHPRGARRGNICIVDGNPTKEGRSLFPCRSVTESDRTAPLGPSMSFMPCMMSFMTAATSISFFRRCQSLRYGTLNTVQCIHLHTEKEEPIPNHFNRVVATPPPPPLPPEAESPKDVNLAFEFLPTNLHTAIQQDILQDVHIESVTYRPGLGRARIRRECF